MVLSQRYLEIQILHWFKWKNCLHTIIDFCSKQVDQTTWEFIFLQVYIYFFYCLAVYFYILIWRNFSVSGVKLNTWSFSNGELLEGPTWKDNRPTYYIFYSHGLAPTPWTFWLDFKVWTRFLFFLPNYHAHLGIFWKNNNLFVFRFIKIISLRSTMWWI